VTYIPAMPERLSADSIRSEILRLAPWYFDIEVADNLRTNLFLEAPERPGTSRIEVHMVQPESGAVSRRQAFVPREHVPDGQPYIRLIDAHDDFLRTLRAVYPEGLENRSVLDCACNAGAYLFWAKEAGAGRCFGFDVREHWIEQANFIASHRGEAARDMSFATSDLYDLPTLGLEQFDIVLFNGIFYHLPDPIAGLRIAAEHATEVLILDTATRRALPDAALVATEQTRTHISSGIHGLRWLPVGPHVLLRLLGWLGFAEAICTWWHPRGAFRDRIEIVAARNKGTLDALEAGRGKGEERIRAIVNTSVPPDTDILVASAGNDALLALSQRRGWHFPQNADGSHAPGLLGDQQALEAHLEALAGAGADYLVVPLSVRSGLDATPEFLERLQARYQVVWRAPGTCVICYLGETKRPAFDPQALARPA
jgi:SAM-dependent methyltransferase